MRRFVVGDIHGAYKALKQCLERSGFDYEKDLLLSVGDICDGWPQTNECIQELLKIKHLKVVLGNHDQWALGWMKNKMAPILWLSQGGRQTVDSYNDNGVPKDHLELLLNADLYHLTDDNLLIVHAGIDPEKDLNEQDEHDLLWNRDFYNMLSDYIHEDNNRSFTGYQEVYIGHTPIHRIGFYKPKKVGEVWLMDTGAAWDGVLSLMDIDTKEVFVSDKPIDMYPKGSGRV